MAISYTQVPVLITPIYSPTFITMTSAYSGETGFKYLIKVTSVDGDLIYKKILPFPGGYGRIDISNVLKDQLSYEFQYNVHSHTNSGLTDTTGSIMEYIESAGHTGSTNSSALTPIDLKYAINVVDYNNDFNFENYILDGESKRFLTNCPTTIDIGLNDYYTLSFLNGNFSTSYYNSIVKYIHIEAYTSPSVQPSIYRIFNSDSGHTPTNFTTTLENIDKMYKTFGCGPANINQNHTLYEVISGTYISAPFITDNILYYTIHCVDDANQRCSHIFRFNVTTDDRYGNSQVAFLNRLGNFSYFTFKGKTREFTKQNKSTFLKNRYSGTNTWTTTNSSRGTTTYSSDIIESVTFTSDYINQDVYNYMEELFTSPVVYYLKDGDALPIEIVDTDWEKKKVINDKVINFTMKCEYSNKKNVNV